ncbi:MAG: acyl-CoA dehydrogenase C-terminal domain-containing protein [Xanthomonadaceae bacterium]|nr:acyl-CoA dehydrogenase C-terminal domain-containing protein [Xanthomonadaceae bacterium]
MSTAFTPPLDDLRFVLDSLIDVPAVQALPGQSDTSRELIDAVLEEAGKFSAQVLAPLNREGDIKGSRWKDGEVTSAPGFRDAYAQYCESGWNALPFPVEWGGQGLPNIVSSPVSEMVMSANLSFSLCPMLTAGAVSALVLVGSDHLRKTYLPKMIDGSWTGTMNLTEPQAGSDLSLVRTRAVPEGDHYRVSGQKIFITWGEHDMTENIVHLVLARLPDAPEGVKGISLFVVPKFLVNPDGSLGARNDVRCASLEHKLGIHASPTAVLNFGEKDGAIGYLVGEANRGLEYMFIMMNEARYAVGVQGIAIGERAYQQAAAYAHERLQGRDISNPRGPTAPIARQPDVRRMLLTMRAITEANRALSMTLASLLDHGRAGNKEAQALAEFLVPIHKGWATEAANEVTSLGVQVHGGMGFIEETGAAQHLRDARITAIYEGTTAIQANDLIGRKTARDGGAAAAAIAAQIRAAVDALDERDPDLTAIRARLASALEAFEACAAWVVQNYAKDPIAVHAGSVPFLVLSGLTCGGWQMARMASVARRRLDAGEGDAGFNTAKLKTARFYADHLLTRVAGLREQVLAGASAIAEFPEERF